jgi:hypothetical protein
MSFLNWLRNKREAEVVIEQTFYDPEQWTIRVFSPEMRAAYLAGLASKPSYETMIPEVTLAYHKGLAARRVDRADADLMLYIAYRTRSGL